MDKKPFRLSVIIPVFNEQATVLELLSRVRAQNFEKEIIVVDDGSTDGTRDLLKRESGLVYIEHKLNKGKGPVPASGTGSG